jgi:N-acetylmuramoyl-L-alanine amidase
VRISARLAIVIVAALVVSGHSATASTPSPSPSHSAEPTHAASVAAADPLAGITVVIDPGHQLGNAQHPKQINRQVDAGGFKKACNTTGTATNGGYPEATFTFKVATVLKRKLHNLGATVVMTRRRNSHKLWGPCVDVRGKIGNKGFRGRKHAADLKVSIHGDGAASGDHGFHVIVADKRAKRKASTAYAKATRFALGHAGLSRANYIAGGKGLMYRGDLGTLNLSRIPTIMVEMGNMRNRADAHRMISASGQRRYAGALLHGIRRYVAR